jgi:phosphoribosylamine-glycine ligase
VIVAPPFPVEVDLEEPATSLGEKLWIVGKDGKPIDDFTPDQLRHIHLQNFKKNDEGNYIVATKGGYLLTVTGYGNDIADARKKMLEYIKNNLYITDMGYRQDLGENVEKYY